MSVRRIVISTVAHLAAVPPLRYALYLVALTAAALLAGCGTQQLVEVPAPIPVECREDTPARPAMPTDGLQAGSTLHAKVTAMEAEIDLREAYELRLAAALANCKRPIAPAGASHGQ